MSQWSGKKVFAYSSGWEVTYNLGQMSFCSLDWNILLSSFKNIKLSFSNYPSLPVLEVHKYEGIENAIKIKDKKNAPRKSK